ncbi:MAG: DUF5615 family PIN-like protein [Bryobacteraceae bacterium]
MLAWLRGSSLSPDAPRGLSNSFAWRDLNVQLLLDENISPALVNWLARMGVYAQAVPHIGLAGRPDPESGTSQCGMTLHR